MNKIPVGATILRGYGYAVRRLLPNLGLSWLAAVFYAMAVCYWLRTLGTTMLVSPHPGSELNDFAFFDLFCLVVVTALANAIIAVALTQAALEPGGSTVAAYFVVAKREWHLFLGLLRLYALMIAVLFAIVFFGGIAITMALSHIGAGAQWQGVSALSAMDGVLAFIAIAAMVFFRIRFGFFLGPLATAQASARLTGGWALSRRNFWRLLVVFATLALPAVFLWAIVGWTLAGQDFGAALAIAVSARHDSTALYQFISDNAASIAAAWAAFLVLLNMVFAGASAFAYPLVRDEMSVQKSRSPQSPVFAEPSLGGQFASYSPLQSQEPRAGNFVHGARGESFEPAALETPMSSHDEQKIPLDMRETPIGATAETAAAIAEEDQPHELAVEVSATAAAFEPEPERMPALETVGMPDSMVAGEGSMPSPIDEHADTLESEQEATMAAAQFPLSAENVITLPIGAEEGASFTPLPSHGDVTESSLPNGPSEAA